MSYLSDFEVINGGYVAFGGNPKGDKITGIGKIRTGKLDFDDVYFVKELKFNLFSVSQMCDKKNSVLFTDTECIILSSEFKLPDENQVLLRVPRENNMYNVDLKNIVPFGDLTFLFVKETLDESNLWHRRLGHINFKTINKVVKGKFDWKADEGFLIGYSISSKAFREPEFEVEKPEFEVHVSPSSSAKTKKHDDKTKREAKVKSHVELSTGFKNLFKEFEDFSDDSTNKVNAASTSVPAVRQISTNSTNTFSAAGPSNTVGNPQHALKDKEVIDNTECIVLSPDFKRPDENQVMLRVPRENNMYNVDLKNIVPSRDLTCLFAKAILDESNLCTPVPTVGQISTNSTNTFSDAGPSNTVLWKTLLIINDEEDVGAEADFSNLETNIIVGPIPTTRVHKDHHVTQIIEKAREGNVKKYVLFPLWSSSSKDPQNTNDDATFEVKEPEFKVEKPESEVHVSPSNSVKTKKHDEKTKREAKGKKADFSNLETNIIVGPIPTTRVHKDHHVTQIIGDLSSATQTRSMTRMVKDQGEPTQINNEYFHTCMFSCFLLQKEPKRIHQVLKDPSWIEAMQEELLQFKMQNAWVLVDLPKGHTQEEGIDYEEVFAPVARIEAIRLFLAYPSFMGFKVYQMDVKSSFLYGTIKEEVYICQPLRFEDLDYPDKVYKVVKALYGLHQDPRAWYETLANYLLENGFQSGKIDQTLFIKKQKGDILCLC
nr:hypothetical protein [Tanacetum cinerariifolium]